MTRLPPGAGDAPPRVEIARVYEPISTTEGHRVLVDRLWPRGIARASAPIDEWDKAIAPSADLRKWYSHDPAKYVEFARRYRAELTSTEATTELDRLRRIATDSGLVLVTAVRDVPISAATVLRDVILG